VTTLRFAVVEQFSETVLSALQKLCRHERVLLQWPQNKRECIETIAQHSQQSKCADQAFGLKGSTDPRARPMTVSKDLSLSPDLISERRQTGPRDAPLVFGVGAFDGLSTHSIPMPLNETESIDSGQVCLMGRRGCRLGE